MVAAKRKRNYLIVLVALVLVVAVILSLLVYLNSYAGSKESVTVGVFPSTYNSLVFIAEDQQFFSANGLNVTFKNYASGAAAVLGLSSNEVDIATAAEFVVANNIMKNASIYAFGSCCKYLNLYTVARTDAGINYVSDLVGKRIGVPLGTSLEFYLGRFLELNKLGLSQVVIVNVSLAETPNAFANDSIDAAVTFQPYINQIQNILDNKTVSWPAQADQVGYSENICTQPWAMAHPDLIVRYLKALVQAETFIDYHQDQAIALVARDLNFTVSDTASFWLDLQYSVSLDQSFVLLMQDQARWLINNNLTSATSVPDFLDYIYTDGLRSVRPESINVIGVGG